jgi:hypothetical protein
MFEWTPTIIKTYKRLMRILAIPKTLTLALMKNAAPQAATVVNNKTNSKKKKAPASFLRPTIQYVMGMNITTGAALIGSISQNILAIKYAEVR